MAEINEPDDSNSHLLKAFDYLESGVILYDPDDRIVFCNRRFRALYSEIADSLVAGALYEEVARAYYRHRHDPLAEMSEAEYVAQRVARHRNPVAEDSEYHMRDGTVLLISDRKTPDGYVIGFRMDITARKRAEAQLAEVERQATRDMEAKVQERTRDLHASNRRLEETLRDLRNAQGQLVQSEKLASLGHLVAGIAHEINTPIGNALLLSTTLAGRSAGLKEVIAGKVTRRELEGHIEDLVNGCRMLTGNLERAASLVRGFKQLAIDRATEQRRVFNLHQSIQSVILSMGPILKRSPFELQVDVPEDIELDSFPGPLSQIIVNFINNALLHAFEDREQGRMTLHAAVMPGERLVLRFSDDGCGMSADVLDHVFDPFYTTKLGKGGSGLGMHIVYNLTTQVLGGQIQVESKPEQGTQWTLDIPVVAP